MASTNLRTDALSFKLTGPSWTSPLASWCGSWLDQSWVVQTNYCHNMSCIFLVGFKASRLALGMGVGPIPHKPRSCHSRDRWLGLVKITTLSTTRRKREESRTRQNTSDIIVELREEREMAWDVAGGTNGKESACRYRRPRSATPGSRTAMIHVVALSYPFILQLWEMNTVDVFIPSLLRWRDWSNTLWCQKGCILSNYVNVCNWVRLPCKQSNWVILIFSTLTTA